MHLFFKPQFFFLLCITLSCDTSKNSRSDGSHQTINIKDNSAEIIPTSTLSESQFFDPDSIQTLKPIEWSCPDNWQPIHEKNNYSFSWCKAPQQWDKPLGPVTWPQIECSKGYQKNISSTYHDISWCEPVFSNTFDEYPDCQPYQFWYPELENGCIHIGVSCPEGNFFSDLPSGKNIIYVFNGSLNGNGSKDNPFGTIKEALDTAQSGSMIAIGKGIYEEDIDIFFPVTIIGACVDQTIIHPDPKKPDNNKIVVLIENTSNVQISNLTIRGNKTGVGVSKTDSSVILRDLYIDSTSIAGIYIDNNSGLTIEDVRIYNTQPLKGGNVQLGFAIYSDNASELAIKRVMLDHNSGGGLAMVKLSNNIIMEESSTVDISQSYIAYNENIIPNVDTTQFEDGYGVMVINGNLTLSDSVFVRNHHSSILVSGKNSHVAANNVYIYETLHLDSSSYGTGAAVEDGASFNASSIVFQKNTGSSIVIASEGNAAISNFIISDTLSEASHNSNGYGLLLKDDSTAILNTGLFFNNRESAILLSKTNNADVQDYSISLEAENIVVSHTQPESDVQMRGEGIAIWNGIVSLKNSLIENNYGSGITIARKYSLLDAQNLKISSTQSRKSDGYFGVGINQYLGAHSNLKNVTIYKNQEAGIFLDGNGTELTGENIIVSDTFGRSVDQARGYGIFIKSGASATIMQLLLTDNHGVNLGIIGTHSQLTGNKLILKNQKKDEYLGISGNNMTLDQQSHAKISDTIIINSSYSALRVNGGSYLEGNNIIIDSTQEEDSSTAPDWMLSNYNLSGNGVQISDGGEANINNIIIRNAQSFGLFISGENSKLTTNNLTLRDTKDSLSLNNNGIGIIIADRASAILKNIFLENNKTTGISLFTQAHGVLDNVFIAKTELPICEITKACDTDSGHGLYINSSTISMNNFIVKKNRLAGISISGDSEFLFHNGIIKDNPIGLNFAPDFNKKDFLKEVESIYFENNQNNIDAQNVLLEPPDSEIFSPVESIQDGENYEM